ncbi:T9SS type B sorting domain-containing protein, partial [Flavobacterium sp.]|uniref:T9SS type B sorting domain-containing protein n=1 Tax=Flavobacterium sp. TaxID=239 RepID=UPI00286EB1F5
IVVNPSVVPEFASVNPICSGDNLLALPNTSTNSITGTWSPALNNLATTTYTFTPNAGQCATSKTLTIVVNPSVVPEFATVNPICSGDVLSALPTTSTNSISGTWSPALNNLATTTYTFTPNAGQCATSKTLTIVVNLSVVPAFATVNPICSGDNLLALPNTSTNSITGTWSPALNTLATTTYTFTPNAGQCATSKTLTIVVNPSVVPEFASVNPICSGDNLLPLPNISTNSITGTWSPPLNNLATTTYTFTPNAGQCAPTKTMTITVNPSASPTFTQVNPICSGATLSALPTTSTNSISGTWSPALNNLATTTYTFTPNTGQCSTNTIMKITVDQNLNIILNDGVICTNSKTGLVLQGRLLETNLPSSSYTFQWFLNGLQILNANENSFIAKNIGNYNVIATNITANCVLNSNIAVISEKIFNEDFYAIVKDDFTEYSSISIFETAGAQMNIRYQLDNGEAQESNTFNNVNFGEHKISVFDLEGCINKEITVFVLGFPKFFTPNGDGFNDTWNLSGKLNQPTARIEIYDRYGKLLTIIKPDIDGWDGLYNSRQVISDDYWFVLHYNEGKIFKSHFSLKR